jgi:hypothetical protein
MALDLQLRLLRHLLLAEMIVTCFIYRQEPCKFARDRSQKVQGLACTCTSNCIGLSESAMFYKQRVHAPRMTTFGVSLFTLGGSGRFCWICEAPPTIELLFFFSLVISRPLLCKRESLVRFIRYIFSSLSVCYCRTSYFSAVWRLSPYPVTGLRFRPMVDIKLLAVMIFLCATHEHTTRGLCL